MTDDTLVKRLRKLSVPKTDWHGMHSGWYTPEVCEQAADRIAALEAENAELREHTHLLGNAGKHYIKQRDELAAALREFAVHGIPRIDHNPTRLFYRTPETEATEKFWSNYFATANRHVKEDAAAALAKLEKDDG